MLSMLQITIQSVVLCCNHQTRISSLSVHTIFLISTAHNFGSKLAKNYVPIHEVKQELGGKMCHALLALHAITGCDSTSALARIGKKKGWPVLLPNEQHQDSLGLLGSQENLSDDIATQCKAFICDLYARSRMNLHTVDELRYFLFCQNRKQKNELLPPTSDSLLQHLKRVNYQMFVWRKALTAIQLPPKVTDG